MGRGQKASLGIGLGVLLAVGLPQQSEALTVGPGRTELRVAPGQKAQGELTATNDGPVPLHVELSTKDWFVLDANQAHHLTVNTWLKLKGKKEFDLKPGENRNVTFKVNCPKDAEGELVAMVSFLYTSGPASMMTPMISVSVYLEAAGTEKRSGEIKELVVRSWNNQIQAAVNVASTGNVHLRPTGALIVTSDKGEEVVRFAIKEAGPAYPGKSQAYFADVPTNFKFSPGAYTIRAALDYRGLALNAERTFKVLTDGKVQMTPKVS